tara:strand:+ start:232 stop:1413 length:1182 start_codon:yes stop_codon:yes gene_type:complete
MKKLLLLLSVLFLISWGCEGVELEDGLTLFTKNFGGNLWDYGNSVQQTIDGGYIITGEISSSENGSSDIWLIKTDSEGQEEWNQTFDGNDRDYGKSVKQTVDGGYIIIGSTGSDYYYDVWLIKTDPKGTEEWNQTFDGDNKDYGNSVQQTIDGGYIITGEISSSGNGSSDVLLIKTDQQGQEEWIQTFGGSDYDIGNSIEQTYDGGYIITGSTRSYGNGSSDVLLIKTDQQGQEEWIQTFGGGYIDIGNSIKQTSDNGYIITGYTQSYGNGSRDVWLIKTNSQGNEEWNQTFGGSYIDIGNSIQQTIDGGYIITGSRGTDYYSDLWLIKTDYQGNEEWNQTFGGNDYDFGNSVQQTTDDGYIIIGHTKSYGNGGYDIFLIKTDSDGNAEPYRN